MTVLSVGRRRSAMFDHRNSLVLRGVSVLVDGPAVGLRLGSYETNAQASQATPISKRHPSLPSRRSPAYCAGRTIGERWSAAVGGPWFTAAVRLCPERAKRP